MEPDTIITTTDRLTLRYFDENLDRDIFSSYRNDQVNGKYQSWPHPYGEDLVSQFFDEMRDRDIHTKNSWLQLAATFTESGELIGDCAFNSDGKTAEIGITVRREFQRKGLAKEMITALLTLLFTELNLHRVIAFVDVDNVGSIELMKSVGFRQEGHHIKSYWDERFDEWRDEYFFAILVDEFVT